MSREDQYDELEDDDSDAEGDEPEDDSDDDSDDDPDNNPKNQRETDRLEETTACAVSPAQALPRDVVRGQNPNDRSTSDRTDCAALPSGGAPAQPAVPPKPKPDADGFIGHPRPGYPDQEILGVRCEGPRRVQNPHDDCSLAASVAPDGRPARRKVNLRFCD